MQRLLFHEPAAHQNPIIKSFESASRAVLLYCFEELKAGEETTAVTAMRELRARKPFPSRLTRRSENSSAAAAADARKGERAKERFRDCE
jgi:hypothetical protein